MVGEFGEAAKREFMSTGVKVDESAKKNKTEEHCGL